ncbi:MAG: hypothetical protein JNJ40_18825 [Bacteroidia bacterium]|nr:hypothetical protein [Bacteroidia bacterium]
MKNFVLLFALIFSLKVVPENRDIFHGQNGDKYCAKLKDGKIMVVHEGNPITADITLTNGSTIKSDGTVITKDGTSFTLKEGECVDKNGAMPSKK